MGATGSVDKKEIPDVFGLECLTDKIAEQLAERGIDSFDQKTKQYITKHLEKCAYCSDFTELLKTKPLSEEEMKKYKKLTPEKIIEYCRNYVKKTEAMKKVVQSAYPPIPQDIGKRVMKRIEEEKKID